MKEFFENLLRYPGYLITFTLGVLLSAFGWVKPLMKNPVTAVAAIGIVVGIFVMIFFTLRAMLGLSTV